MNLLLTPRRRGALVAASATALASLALAAPALAAPVFVDADTSASGDYGVSARTAGCADTPTGTESPDTPVVENGPATTTSAQVSGTGGTTSGDLTDTVSFSAQSTGTSTVRSAAGNPTSIDLQVAGSGALDFAHAASACTFEVYAGHILDFHFTVTQAGYLHLTEKAPAGFYGQLEISSDTDPGVPYYESYGFGLKFNAKDDVFLPAGTYTGDFEGYVDVSGNADRTVNGTLSVHGAFTVAGSQTAVPSGKGKKYVTLPGARSCATHSLAASVTGKKKKAEDVKQITFRVNDQKVKKVKKPKKGEAVTIPAADDQAADVVAEIQLFPSKKGKPGKTLEVSASYEACS